jgi:alkyl hydroperoxide reductase subunit AhpF
MSSNEEQTPQEQNPLHLEGAPQNGEVPAEIVYDNEQEHSSVHVSVTSDPEGAPTAQTKTTDLPLDTQHGIPKEDYVQPHEDAQHVFDCTIIGAGPTGLYGAFYAGMREMSVKIIDSLAEIGGQLNALYPEKYIYDVAGFPAVKAKDLVTACQEQGLQFGPTVCLGEKVETLEKGDDGVFTLTTDKGTHKTRTIIIAAGVGAFTPRKLPDAPEVDQLEGKSVFYFVKSFEPFRD